MQELLILCMEAWNLSIDFMLTLQPVILDHPKVLTILLNMNLLFNSQISAFMNIYYNLHAKI